MSDYYGPPGGGNTSSQVGNSSNSDVGGRSHQPQQQQQQQQYQHKSNQNNYHHKSYNNDQCKIFVGGLSWQTTEESLQFHFEQFGPVASVDVMRDRNTGDPRGFAFVVFRDASTIDLVMNEEKHEINHKIVDVKRAQARGQAPPSIHGGGDRDSNSFGNNNSSNNPNENQGNRQFNNQHNNRNQQQQLTPEQLHNKVFVGGIPPHIDRDGLKEIFEEFGPVVDAIVMVDQVTNRSRCFGFVTFENGSNGAQKAIEKQPLNIQGRHVEVKLATPKSEQRRMPASAGPKHVGLRAGMSGASSSSGGKYAGFAVAYGRSGWKAGYGTFAFGQAGWGVKGWEDIGGIAIPERVGFSFSMLEEGHEPAPAEPPSKRARH
jgi:RNA-binding protein Musashi